MFNIHRLLTQVTDVDDTSPTHAASAASFAHPGTALITCAAKLFQLCQILIIRHWTTKYSSGVLYVTLGSRASSASEVIVPPSCVVSECG